MRLLNFLSGCAAFLVTVAALVILAFMLVAAVRPHVPDFVATGALLVLIQVAIITAWYAGGWVRNSLPPRRH